MAIVSAKRAIIHKFASKLATPRGRTEYQASTYLHCV